MKIRGQRAIIVLAIFLSVFFLLPYISYSQSEADPAEESELVQPEINPALPSDIPTRETFQPENSERAQLGPSAVDYFKTFASLAVVIGIIYGLSVLMKRFVVARGLSSTSENLKILYSLSVTPTRTLYVVRFGERILLIGSGEGGMRTLSEITDPVEVSGLLRDMEFKGNYDFNPFKEQFKKLSQADHDDSELIEDFDTRQRRIKSSLDRLKKSSSDE
ncbi:MAG TPA: flagellar biosynthetic protein FliO [bacterium]|jgi:flagellar biosynthetic protein FliO